MGRKAIAPELKAERKKNYNQTYYQQHPEHWTRVKKHGSRSGKGEGVVPETAKMDLLATTI